MNALGSSRTKSVSKEKKSTPMSSTTQATPSSLSKQTSIEGKGQSSSLETSSSLNKNSSSKVVSTASPLTTDLKPSSQPYLSVNNINNIVKSDNDIIRVIIKLIIF
jgi:hypothetical protein